MRELQPTRSSFETGKRFTTNIAHTIADGVACRTPIPEAVSIIIKGAERIVRVPDNAIIDEAYFIYRYT
ncbi:MAG: hypothetical protein R3E60_01315 [Alphaproteobacteria bacterium]